MKKKIVVFISMALAVGMLAFGLTACGTDEEKKPAEPNNAITDVNPDNVDDGEAVDKTKDDGQEAAEDTISVAFGDTEAQEKLSKDIQNGDMLDKTVTIDGISRKIGTKYSIGQLNDGKFIGTVYTMEGEYPAEDAHVVVTGTVVKDGYAFNISAVSVDVVEDAEAEDGDAEDVEAVDAEKAVDAEDIDAQVEEDVAIKNEEADANEEVVQSSKSKNRITSFAPKDLKNESEKEASEIKVTPSADKATTNQKFSFTVEAGDLEVKSYEWQMFANDDWKTINNNKSASTDTLDIATPSKLINGCKYRCVMTLEDGSEVISEEAVISVE